MKKRTLKILFILTLIYELVLMFLTYQAVGDELLTKQSVRLGIESLLFLVLITGESKVAFYLLIGYNIFTGVVAYGKIDGDNSFMFLMVAHFIVAIGIFLNEWIDEGIDSITNNTSKNE